MASTRVSRLQKRLASLSVPAVIISNLTNIRYLTSIQASAGLLLVTKKQVVLFVDSRYSEVASRRAEKGIVIADPTELQRYLSRFKTLGFESDSVTVARLDRWKKQLKNKKFVQIKDFVEGLRAIKDIQELTTLTEACAITKMALRKISSMLRYGMTERELALDIYVYCMNNGADGMAFETIVGFGENTSKPHHRPSDRKLKKGDIVQIDMGAMYRGYCSDYSRVYFTSEPTPKQRKAYRALKEAKKAAEKILRPGVLNTKLDEEARRVLLRHGFDKEFSHSLGHGVGMDIHEGTTLSKRAAPVKLRKNEVVTIEPGLYFKGRWGMRIEDTIVIR
ncbi:MAG: aminopeptidase P family protein [Candidatus Peribacteraceae bacterium]|nr:aminopeptidase P family protein [Candidatus Peribacteraceae bacterium]